MSDISISPAQFFIIGIPQGLLFVLATYIFTKTRFNSKKYISISSIVTILTYLIRFLPITIGVNSMLSLLVLIVVFLVSYKFDLPKIVNLIASSIVIFIIICISEFLNEFVLNLVFGKVQSQAMLNSGSPLIRSLSMLPTNIFFAAIILIIYFILLRSKNRRGENGETCKKTDK